MSNAERFSVVMLFLCIFTAIAVLWTLALAQDPQAVVKELGEDEWFPIIGPNGNTWYIRESAVTHIHSPDPESARRLECKSVIHLGGEKVYSREYSIEELVKMLDQE